MIAELLECNHCGGAVTMTDDNGVVDPTETRVEYYTCPNCNTNGELVMIPNDEEIRTGCIE